MMRPTKNSPAAVDQSQLAAKLDSLDEYCCRKHWITILTATVRRRKGERHTVVIHQDEELVGWATWWARHDLWHIVVLPGGGRWYRYESLSEFLRVIGEELEVETTDTMVKLWGQP